MLSLVDVAAAQSPAAKLIGEDSHTPQLPQNDAIRIHEFYRLAPQIADEVWPGWSRTIAPLLLVTSQTEFLTHHPDPPDDFEKIGDNPTRGPGSIPLIFSPRFPPSGLSRSSSSASLRTPRPKPARPGSSL